MHKPPQLSRTNTRVNRRNVGEAPRPKPGSPAPPPRCEELAGSHSPPGPGTLCPPCPWAQLRSVGAPSQSRHPQSAARGPAASWTCLWHSHCPYPHPWPEGEMDGMGWDGMGSSCLRAAPPLQWCSSTCATKARGGQGPVPRALTQRDSNGGGTNPGLSGTSRSTEAPWSRQSQAAKGGQAQPLGSSIASSCSHPRPPTAQDSSPHTLTGDRLSLPAAWSLPRSSPAVSGSHRGTASLSSVGGDARGQQGWIRIPSLPSPCWVSQTCAFPHPASSVFPASGACCAQHSPSTAIL